MQEPLKDDHTSADEPSDSRVVFSLWIGDQLGPWEQLCLESFLKRGYDFHLFTYGPVAGVPDGVILRDGREIEPESNIFQPEAHGKTFSGFSNLFRYSALNKFHGVWVDLDVLCLSHLPQTQYVLGFETLGRVNGAILSYPPGSELGIFLESACRHRSRYSYGWGDLGPRLITEAVWSMNLWKLVAPISTFYPVHFRETWRLFDPHSELWLRRRVKKSVAVHLWKNVLGKLGDNPNLVPSESNLTGLGVRGMVDISVGANRLGNADVLRWRQSLLRIGPRITLAAGHLNDSTPLFWRLHKLAFSLQRICRGL